VSSARRSRAGVLTGALRRKSADRPRVTAQPIALSWGFRRPRSCMPFVERSRRTSSATRRPTLMGAARHDQPSPGAFRTRSFPRRLAPPEFLASSRLADSRSAPAPRGLLALRRRHSTGPRMRRTVRVRHGSAPGVSHPLSGFLARSGLRPSRPLPSLGFSPFRAFPSRGSRSPRRGRWLPCRSSGSVPWCGARGLVTPGFTDHRRRSGVVGRRLLAGARGSLSAALLAEHHLPVTLDLARRAHLVPVVASASKRSSPPRVRSRRAAVSRGVTAGALLGVLAPPEPCSRHDLGSSTLRVGGVPPAAMPARPEKDATDDHRDPHVRASRGSRHERLHGRPSTPGGFERGRPNRPARPVGGDRSRTLRAVPPLGGNLDSHDLSCRGRTATRLGDAMLDRVSVTPQV